MYFDLQELYDYIQKKEDIKDGIILTTAHSAKGLEFEKVFLLTPTSNYWGNCPQDGFFPYIKIPTR